MSGQAGIQWASGGHRAGGCRVSSEVYLLVNLFSKLYFTFFFFFFFFFFLQGVVGSGNGVVYLTSPGRPTEIGLQLGKACYPCSR